MDTDHISQATMTDITFHTREAHSCARATRGAAVKATLALVKADSGTLGDETGGERVRDSSCDLKSA